MQQTQVRRHLVAGGEQHDVARHQFCGVDAPLLAAAQHRGFGGQRARQRRQRGEGPALLDETDDGIERHHAEDHAGIHPGAQTELDHHGGRQDVDQRLVELQQEPQQRPLATARGQRIGAEALPPRFHLEAIQALLLIGVEQVQHLALRQVMPVFFQQGIHDPVTPSVALVFSIRPGFIFKSLSRPRLSPAAGSAPGRARWTPPPPRCR